VTQGIISALEVIEVHHQDRHCSPVLSASIAPDLNIRWKRCGLEAASAVVVGGPYVALLAVFCA
jgi:hypothetical protein